MHNSYTYAHAHHRTTGHTNRDTSTIAASAQKMCVPKPNNKVCIDMLTFYQILCKFVIGACCYFFGSKQNGAQLTTNKLASIANSLESHSNGGDFFLIAHFFLCHNLTLFFLFASFLFEKNHFALDWCSSNSLSTTQTHITNAFARQTVKSMESN